MASFLQDRWVLCPICPRRLSLYLKHARRRTQRPRLKYIKMTKRTRKVGVTGKYGTRYGASLRKQVKKMEITQHARYTCTFCGKVSQTIWTCEDGVGSNRGGYHAGLRKAPGRRHLEVQLVQEGHRWWRVDCLDNGGCDRSQHRSSAPGDHGGVILSGRVSCSVFLCPPRIYMSHAMSTTNIASLMPPVYSTMTMSSTDVDRNSKLEALHGQRIQQSERHKSK
ncbi:hypothetical protein VTO73DRAFT_4719 [Trametes versicolor]